MTDPIALKVARRFSGQQEIQDDVVSVAPPGWEGPVKEMKKDKDIDNPWALAWSMKNKGDHPHKKEAELAERVVTRFFDRQIVQRVAARFLANVAMEHASPEEMKKYLHEHPGADPKNHTVKKPGGEHGPAEAEGAKGQARFEVNKKLHSDMKALVKKVENADPSAKKKFDSAYDKLFESGEKAAGAAKKLVEKYHGSKEAEDAVEMLDHSLRQWEHNKLDHHKARGAISTTTKMHQAENTYGYAQMMDATVKDFHKMLKDPDFKVDDSWRNH